MNRTRQWLERKRLPIWWSGGTRQMRFSWKRSLIATCSLIWSLLSCLLFFTPFPLLRHLNPEVVSSLSSNPIEVLSLLFGGSLSLQVKHAYVMWRERFHEVLELLEKHDIPLLVFSAGIADLIEEVFRQLEKRYSFSPVTLFLVRDSKSQNSKARFWSSLSLSWRILYEFHNI